MIVWEPENKLLGSFLIVTATLDLPAGRQVAGS